MKHLKITIQLDGQGDRRGYRGYLVRDGRCVALTGPAETHAEALRRLRNVATGARQIVIANLAIAHRPRLHVVADCSEVAS